MIKGLDKLTAQLEAIADADYTDALLKGGQVIFDEMQARTPVDKGDLKESEGLEAIGRNKIELSAGTDHAEFVEFGTSNQAPQSYMRSAIDSKADEAMKAVANEVNKIMQAAV